VDRQLAETVVGAEATVHIYDDVVVKRRRPKSYRIKELDARLRKERTRVEAKIQSDARRAGVPTPVIRDVNGCSITMERIKGEPVRYVINELIAEQVGEVLGRLHSSGIAHGDPTTFNMIFSAGRVYLIDFGLAYYDGSLEARGVDLHVFFQTLEAMHKDAQSLKDAFVIGYAKYCPDAMRVIDKVNEIKQRGRYL